MDIAIQLLFY